MKNKTVVEKKSKKALAYENLVSEIRKVGGLVKYVGIADAHGIEFFMTEAEFKASPYPMLRPTVVKTKKKTVYFVLFDEASSSGMIGRPVSSLTGSFALS